MTMNDVILLTLMRRKTNMINSRQIVEILNEEISKNKDIENVRLALQKVKDRIEFLEELEFVHQHKPVSYTHLTLPTILLV